MKTVDERAKVKSGFKLRLDNMLGSLKFQPSPPPYPWGEQGREVG